MSEKTDVKMSMVSNDFKKPQPLLLKKANPSQTAQSLQSSLERGNPRATNTPMVSHPSFETKTKTVQPNAFLGTFSHPKMFQNVMNDDRMNRVWELWECLFSNFV